MAALQCLVSVCFTQGHPLVGRVSETHLPHFPVMIPCEGNFVRLCEGVRGGGSMDDIQAKMSSHVWERKFHFGPNLVVDRPRTMTVAVV